MELSQLKNWGKMARAAGTHIFAALVGVGVGLAVNMVWDAYTAPKLSVQYAAAKLEWTIRDQSPNVVMEGIVRDLRSGEVAIRGSLSGSDTVINPIVPPPHYIVNFIISNKGRRPIRNIRIPVGFNIEGFGTVTSTDNVIATLKNTDEGPVTGNSILVDLLQPKSTAVVSYTFESRPMRPKALPPNFSVRVRVPYIAAEGIGLLAVPDTAIPFGMALILQERMTASVVPSFTFSSDLTGRGGEPLEMAVQWVPEYFAPLEERMEIVNR